MDPLATDPNTSTSQSTRPSAPPSSFRMPHVFVIPPEEEQEDNPPWCCFDADKQPENGGDFLSSPDVRFMDDPFLFHPSGNHAPVQMTRRTSVYRPRSRASVSKKLEKKQHPEAIKIVETKSSRIGQKDAQEDSDVVEVVKVKRARGVICDLEENAKAKRSQTLRARATKALQSIKNVGKTSQRPHVKDLWGSPEGAPGIFKGVQPLVRPQQDKSEDRPPFPSPKKGSLSLASSLSLAQLFQPMKLSPPESVSTDRVPSSAPTTETYHTLATANPSSLTYLGYTKTKPSVNEAASALMTNDASNRPVTPIPSTKRSVHTKFSVRELHRLFSFSSPPDGAPPSPTTATAPFLSASNSSKLSISTPSHDGLDVSKEEGIFVDAQFVDLDTPERKLASRYHQAFHTRQSDDLRRLSDFSFEMKLDSLHFDALSFETDDFRISREGGVLH